MNRPATITGPAASATPGCRIRYRGPLITDTSVPGETKRDGVIPAHPGGGAIQAGRDRWIVFFATLDPAGWDSNRSIIYQVRRQAPNGPVIREGLIDRSVDDWDPLDRGDRLVKSCGMPIAFGVPRGATHGGRPIPGANVFVVKWYRLAHLRCDGRPLHPTHHKRRWPEGLDVRRRTLRVEWLQFRLRDDESDIEVIAGPAMMRQRDHGDGEAFSSLGPAMQMNHSMKPPVPVDAHCREWVEYDTFVPFERGHREHGGIAMVRFTFDPTRGLYEWTQTGPLVTLPGRVIGESSANLVDGRWIIAARGFEYDGGEGCTCWFSTDDPLGSLGPPTITPSPHAPRTVFLCADGVLRLFGNDRPSAAHPFDRSPLCCWDVDPVGFQQTNRRIVLDARAQGLPFHHPFVDMPKLSVNRGRGQWLMYRVITRRQTADQDLDEPVSAAEHAAAGIYCSELTYDHDVPEPWEFAG